MKKNILNKIISITAAAAMAAGITSPSAFAENTTAGGYASFGGKSSGSSHSAATVTIDRSGEIKSSEVASMVFSTGLSEFLSEYQEYLTKTIEVSDEEADVLNPETRTISDVIEPDISYRMYYINESDGKYEIYDKDYDKNDALYEFIGFYKDDRVGVTIYPDDYVIDSLAGTVMYQGILNDTDVYDFIEDYDNIAYVINANNITGVTDINIANYYSCICVYIACSDGDEYVIPAETVIDSLAEELGKTPKTVQKGSLMTLTDFCTSLDEIQQNAEAGGYEVPDDNYVNVRNTDTLSAYIGTESKFSDVSGDLAAYVNELLDLGIVTGYSDGTFKPENTITRGEAAAMLTRIFKLEGTYNGEFADVSADDWYADNIAALAATGAVNGYDNTNFAPQKDIKYQEMMKILVYALGYYYKGMSYPQGTSEEAVDLGLTKGLGSFDTTDALTRGDMAIMLSNALDTHLFTVFHQAEFSVPGNDGIGIVAFTEDITLIDYLNGTPLNGSFQWDADTDSDESENTESE